MTSRFLQISDDIIDKLQDEGILLKSISSFQNLNTNEKLEFIDEILQKYSRRPDVQLRKAKSNEKSAKLRKLGNSHFVSAEYTMALKMYNEAICYAEHDSEEMSLGFANRSAAYWELGWHDECLNNIELAKKTSSFPVRLLDKLNNREAKCLEQRPTDKKEKFPETELSFPANPQVPFIANCLQLEKNAQYGRHVITTTNLKAGDVVAFEESFSSSLAKEYKYTRCENCLIQNNRNLIPCKNCTGVMFCGDECLNEANNKFHKFECPIIDYVKKMFCNNPLLALRTIICAITTFKSVDELISFVEETRGQDLTVFNCRFEDKSRNVYGPVHFLNQKEMDNMEEFTTAMIAAMIYQPLLEFTELGVMLTTTKAIRIFKELVLYYVKVLAINYTTPSYLFEDLLEDLNSSRTAERSQKVREPLAISLHPLRFMFNHSCAPNVIISSYGKKIVFTISRPIKAGEQLFDNYGCHFTENALIKRQLMLTHFECRCVACENRYPLYSKLLKGTIPEMPKDEVKSLDQSCADYINTYADNYPCQELVQAEGILRVYLNIIHAGRV